MAREESDRENLLREATALVERIELATSAVTANDHVVIGFRTDGAMSIFFGADPVYQFNAAGELRRAYLGGERYKAMAGRLAALHRVRLINQVQLVRRDLTAAEQNAFMAEMSVRLRSFIDQLDAGSVAVIGQVPPEADLLVRLREWFANHQSIQVAHRPNA
jgi:hypothetical protein